MPDNKKIDAFLSTYPEEVFERVLRLRKILLSNLPAVTEQVDLPARMIAYCYGQRYIDMVCTIIPSKKGLKLGFYKGNELPDPDKLLEGTGKISRYVVIHDARQINSPAIKKLIKSAFAAYQKRSAAKPS